MLPRIKRGILGPESRNRTGDSGFTKYLTGDWRLVYTTGTRKTEDEIGRINYVPITAVQRFDMEKKFIRNGVSGSAWSRHESIRID